jgi:hypothetical protein
MFGNKGKRTSGYYTHLHHRRQPLSLRVVPLERKKKPPEKSGGSFLRETGQTYFT